MATGFPYSHAIVHIRSRRTEKKSGKRSVEDRNHWRCDTPLGEDHTRLRQGRALMNLALLRRANLRLLSCEGAEDWLPARKEGLAAHSTSALALLGKKL